MKTTEIFAEQVIIGGLVMLIGYILFPQDVENFLNCLNGTFAQISIGVLLVGAAYLIGIVYDRFTDTMFQDLERNCRWNYLLSEKDSDDVLECVKSNKDPYPENIYRMEVMQSESAAHKEDYFRRRLRLTRAFATLIPGISIAIVIYMSTDWTNEPWYKIKAAMIPLAYLLAFLSKNKKKCKLIRGYSPPKTYYKRKDVKKEEEIIDYCKKYKSEDQRSLLRFILLDRTCQILLVFMILAAFYATVSKKNGYIYIIIMLIGTILATIVIWTWWRIYNTYFRFLADFSEANKGEKTK
jgi:hypothetical protein